MKRFLVGFLLGILVATSAVALADNTVRLFVNGREIVFDDAPPQIINGRTMVPAKPLAEALGATVTWVPETRSVLVNSQTVDSEWLTVNEAVQKYGLSAEQLWKSGVLYMKITGNGHAVELLCNPTVAEFDAKSDTGVVVHGRMVNGRMYVYAPDLITAGISR